MLCSRRCAAAFATIGVDGSSVLHASHTCEWREDCVQCPRTATHAGRGPYAWAGVARLASEGGVGPRAFGAADVTRSEGVALALAIALGLAHRCGRVRSAREVGANAGPG